jgi:tRNA(Ile)-lysidine synthase
VSPPVVAVAFSGGRDSTALLHATLNAAAGTGLRVAALHVHHNLMPEADAWLLHAQALCRRWARIAPLQLLHRQLPGAPARGESVEAWARRGRYGALAEMAHEAGATLVLLAHHRRDQAETFLLQALRGGGAQGLAGMPAQVERDGLTWARPWLQQPREAVEAYVRRHRVRYVDDASNADPRYARSRLRTQVWPALQAAFDDAETTLAHAARRAQQDAACLAELASSDLASVGEGDTLALPRWRLLSPPRRALVLRAWLQLRQGRGAEERLVVRLLDEVPAATSPATWPAIGGTVRRYRGRLLWLAAQAPANRAGSPADGPPSVPLSILTPGRHDAGPWGALEAGPVDAGGVPPQLLQHLELRPRRGAERFQSRPGSPPRSLKKQYQAAGVPAWAREGPLVYAGDRLLYVPGLGFDARCLAAPGAPQWRLAWIRAASCVAPEGKP